MNEVFLIDAVIEPDTASIRGVSSDGKDWVAIVDLFYLASSEADPELPSPSRPPINFVALACKVDAKALARPFKGFGIKSGSVNQACQFLAQEGWSTFLVLSGVSEERAIDIADKLKGCFENRRANPPHLIDPDSYEREGSLSEVEALRNRVAALELALAGKDERLKLLERETRKLSFAVRFLETTVEAYQSSETSKELKAQATRLYARSKQLENEGR